MMMTEVKNKNVRSYFSKCTNTTSQKPLLLNSLVNIIKSMKSENFDMKDIQKDTSYHMIPILFSTQEYFVSHLNNESKLSIIKIKYYSDLLIYYICFIFYHSIEHTHTEKNCHNLITEMDIWCDNLKQNLEEAAKEKRLNDFLVSLSASLSMKYITLFIHLS